jgi:quercetin dioxygenase-like cupin family protein
MNSTSYYLRVSNSTRIRRHTHIGEESVFVVQGRMVDFISGKSYMPGETWTIRPGEVHSVVFEAPDNAHGMFLITVEPPLPDSSQATILLDGIHSLAP